MDRQSFAFGYMPEYCYEIENRQVCVNASHCPAWNCHGIYLLLEKHVTLRLYDKCEGDYIIVYSKIAILEPTESYICSIWYHELPVCPPNGITIINERMKRKRQKLNPPSRKSCPEGSPGCSKRSSRPCSPSPSRQACGCSPPRSTRPQPARPRPRPAPRRRRFRCP